MKGRGFLTLVAAAVFLGIAAPQAFAATTRVVDDDGVQCPAPFSATIQAAVNASALGDTVKVCPGTYDESVVIATAGVIVKASSAHPDVARCNGTRTTSNRTFVTGDDGTPNHVNGPGPDSGPAFTLAANNITLMNFVVQNVNGQAGIQTSPSFSGYLVQSNLVQDNTFGLYLNASGGTTSQVLRNCFRDNNVAGAASGNGIYSDQGLAKATIQANLFFNNTSAGMLIENVAPAPPTNITVTGNISRRDNELGFFGLVNSTVTGNIIQMPVIRGLFFGPATTNVLVKGNIIQNSQGHGIRVRNRAGDSGFPTASTGLTIKGNIVQNAAENGIFVEEDALYSSTIQGNIVQSSGWDGMFIGTSNSGNTIQRNIFQNSNVNGPDGSVPPLPFHDCHDESGFPTLNTWTKNIGSTQNQNGLCLFATTQAPTTHP